MEYRKLGASGLNVPVLSFGTATFGGGSDFFKAWGTTQQDEANRMVNLCLDAGVNFFDTANVYSAGLAEEILGKALVGRRHQSILSTKGTFVMGKGPNDFGSSRIHLTSALEDSLRRLGTDYIDLYYMHGFDANTPIQETLSTLEHFIQSGKVRYIGCSNFSGWHLMKSLSISERNGWSKYIAHQVYYSLLDREFEWELMPLAIDQQIATVIWSPLSGGRLGGKIRRGQPVPANTRTAQGGAQGPVEEARLFNVVDALYEVSAECGKSVAQVALNWILHRPTISSIIIGARDEVQLRQNLEVVGWALTSDQMNKLNKASEVPLIYPYWHQDRFPMLNITAHLKML